VKVEKDFITDENYRYRSKDVADDTRLEINSATETVVLDAPNSDGTGRTVVIATNRKKMPTQTSIRYVPGEKRSFSSVY